MNPTICTSAEELRQILPELLPNQGVWSEEEYLVLTGHNGRLIEYTDGYLEVLPMPTTRHQLILALLYKALDAFIAPWGGLVLFSPLRLRIRAGKFREPDLLLLRSKADPRRQNRFWTGADLALEVVSEDKPARDLADKRGDYAEGQIPEYWIVNPVDETIAVLKLVGAAYEEHGIFRRGQQATSATLDGFMTNVDAVFEAD